MVRQAIAASAVVTASIVFPSAGAAAAATGQVVLIEGGQVRCSVSADDLSQGGGPTVVCENISGLPWGQPGFATMKNSVPLNLAVLRGTGQFTWALGSVPAPGETSGDQVPVDEGQTYQVNGWTIQDEGLRTRITYDRSGHGMLVTPAYVRLF